MNGDLLNIEYRRMKLPEEAEEEEVTLYEKMKRSEEILL
jgi:hypothetical protein